jgi:hypothetical protein
MRGHKSTASTSSRAALRDDEGVFRTGALTVRHSFFRSATYVATLTRKNLVLTKDDKVFLDVRVEDIDSVSAGSGNTIQLKFNKTQKIVLRCDTKSKAAGWLAVSELMCCCNLALFG